MVEAQLAAGTGLLKLPPVTFVTGNTKKLEEVKVILGKSIPFHRLSSNVCILFNYSSLIISEILLNYCGSLIDRFAN